LTTEEKGLFIFPGAANFVCDAYVRATMFGATIKLHPADDRDFDGKKY
jgi:hypothetical protein